MLLTGRVAVVTGGGSGVGRGITEGPTALSTPETLERGGRMVPLGRAGHVDEMASAAVFLASDMASFVTGQTIHVDGGTEAAGGWYPHPQTGAYTLGPS